MSDTPIEDTLLVAAHAQMRDRVNHIETIVTSGHQEKTVGYDTVVPALKKVVFQFKRPYRLESGEMKFHIEEYQRETLHKSAGKIGEENVYYALPLIKSHSGLNSTLEKMVFLKATAVEQDTTLVYLSEDFCSGFEKDGKSDIESRVSGDKSENINNDDAICWQKLLDEVEGCNIGRRIFPNQELSNDDVNRYEVELPSGGASTTLFEVKISY